MGESCSYLSIRALPVPTVAAINGPAIGAGMCLAAACDLVTTNQGKGNWGKGNWVVVGGGGYFSAQFCFPFLSLFPSLFLSLSLFPFFARFYPLSFVLSSFSPSPPFFCLSFTFNFFVILSPLVARMYDRMLI